MSNNEMVEQVQNAIRAHGAWKLRLKAAIATGTSTLSVDQVARDDCCDFGKWLYSNKITPTTKNGVPYQVIKRLHSEFHQCAGSVLKEATTGKRETATQLLDGSFTDKSNTLVRALGKWKGELQAGQ